MFVCTPPGSHLVLALSAGIFSAYRWCGRHDGDGCGLATRRCAAIGRSAARDRKYRPQRRRRARR